MGVRDTRKFFGFKILRERERDKERERRGGWVGEENFSALKFSERERRGGCAKHE